MTAVHRYACPLGLRSAADELTYGHYDHDSKLPFPPRMNTCHRLHGPSAPRTADRPTLIARLRHYFR